jgi:hypothetical protein
VLKRTGANCGDERDMTIGTEGSDFGFRTGDQFVNKFGKLANLIGWVVSK